MIKAIAILGSTGSIGRQALEVVAAHPERLEVAVLAATGRQKEVLRRQVERFRPRVVAVADGEAAEYLAGVPGVKVRRGPLAIREALGETAVDIVLNAIGGIAGLRPAWETIQAGKALALANKESLVVAGCLISRAVREKGVPLIPVDSEHSAIFQCRQGREKEVESVILTASGGPFLDYAPEDLAHITPARALQHPNWQMGPRITVDSATMFNKGLEVMEAGWLFDLTLEQIQVVIHPESMVHSMVAFGDGSILAQLAVPDMRIPIQLALSWPERWPSELPRLDLAQMGSLHFLPVPEGRFPCFELALAAARAGGSFPTVLNAADEVAVQLFLEGRIKFSDIPRLLSRVMEQHRSGEVSSIEEILEIDHWSREQTRQIATRLD